MGTIRTIGELEREAAACAARIVPRESGATLLTISGELGVGKTAFVKAFAKALGVEEKVTSPTFVLEKVYALPEGKSFARLIHIDAYRLESAKELAALGFEESMKDSENLVFIEWPERVENALPSPTLSIHLESNQDGVRTISYVP